MFIKFEIHIAFLVLLVSTIAIGQPSSQEINLYDSELPNYFPLSKENFTRLSSFYGYRIHPVHKKIKKHKGIDLAAAKGSGVYASAKGVVFEKSYDASYGNYVVLKHKNKIRTLYGHLWLAAVKQGDTVNKGQIIGYVGDTGLVTGPHLHYEIWVDKERINPFIFWNNTVLKKNEVTNTSK